VAEFLEKEGADVISDAIDGILDAIDILARHPLIGRPVEQELRELVISRGKTGYIALYDYVQEHDVVRVLAIWHQRELRPGSRG